MALWFCGDKKTFAIKKENSRNAKLLLGSQISKSKSPQCIASPKLFVVPGILN